MTAWCFTTDEVVCFIVDVLGDGVESDEENMFREEGDADVDPVVVSGSDSDCPEEPVEEMNKPSRSRHRGCGHRRKMRCVTVVVVGRGGGG